jgi:16S rRNA G966 N2-methylase RsmD
MSYAQTVINNHILKHIFPYIKNKALMNYLRIDDDSVHYISSKNVAEKITYIISMHLNKLNILNENAIITDATAGVGGDTISFCKMFKYVYAIELNKLRYDYLNNNLNVYGISNVILFNQDFLNILPQIEDHNAIFIDPPWGGCGYQKINKLRIKISEIMDLEDICLECLFGLNMKKTVDLIALKLPNNYDIHYLYKKMVDCNIYLYQLDKMIVLIIEKKINMKFDEHIVADECVVLNEHIVSDENNIVNKLEQSNMLQRIDIYAAKYVDDILQQVIKQLSQQNL